MIFLLPVLVAAAAFAALVFVVATHKPFVSPRERRMRMLLAFMPIMVIGYALFGRGRRRKP